MSIHFLVHFVDDCVLMNDILMFKCIHNKQKIGSDSIHTLGDCSNRSLTFSNSRGLFLTIKKQEPSCNIPCLLKVSRKSRVMVISQFYFKEEDPKNESHTSYLMSKHEKYCAISAQSNKNPDSVLVRGAT